MAWLQSWLETPVYEWIKAAHVISMVAWMAGMLYLPRLFVYHTETRVASAESERFKLMERRIIRQIINPAMIATWLFGILLSIGGHWWDAPWFHAKLALVIVLSGYHGMLSRWRRAFEADHNRHSQRFYRIMNEVPTVIMIAVIILVIVKPF